MKYIAFILVSLFIVAGIVGIFFWLDTKVHRGESLQTDSYTIPYDYDKVRKILVRTNSLEALVRGSGDLLDQKWHELSISTPDNGRTKIIGKDSVFKTWILQGEGIFRVRIKDGHFAGEVITLKLKVWINKDQMRFDVALLEPSVHLIKYDSTTFVVRDGARTKFRTDLCIGVQITAPSCFVRHGQVQREVEQSVASDLVNSQRAIEAQINKYKDTRLLIPLTF